MLLRDYVYRAARAYPDKTAFIDNDLHRDWKSFDERTSRFGAALQRMGIGKGDRVCIIAHEHVEVLEHWIACAKIGAVRVGLNWRYSEREKMHIVHNSNAKAILVQANCQEGMAAGLADAEREGLIVIGFGGQHTLRHDYETLIRHTPDRPAHVEIAGTDPLAFSYTTGTTGLPKGAIWTQEGVVEGTLYSLINLGLSHKDIWCMPAPMPGAPILFNTFGMINGMTSVLMGGDFAPAPFWELVERHRVTATGGVPTMIRRLLEEYDSRTIDASSLRNIFYGSSPMPPALIRRLYNTIDCEVIQPYGSTETGGWVTYLREEDHRRALEHGELHLLESCGRPDQHADIRIMDEDGREVPEGDVGEICVRGTSNCVGYHNLPQETKDLFFGEWLRTGDLGRRDARGYHYLVDRRKFMIISGGYNVYPVVVENVLSEHESVREVSVQGAPHPEWGEAVTATIALKPGTSVSAVDLIEFVRPKLGKWEVPKHVEIMEELPKGVTGKIDKVALRQRLKANPDLLPWKQQ